MLFGVDERFLPQDGHGGTGLSRLCENDMPLVHGEDIVEQSPVVVDYEHSSSSKSASTTSRVGKTTGEPYSAAGRQGPLNPAECQRTDATVSERSIYDNAPEHCYANVEKDESGRLLNRDTLAFRTSDYETVNSAKSSTPANGQDGVPHSTETTSTSRDRCCDVPVVVHRINKSSDVVNANSLNHGSAVDRTHSDTATGTVDHVPYHTGRSTFYQRVDSAEGNPMLLYVVYKVPYGKFRNVL